MSELQYESLIPQEYSKIKTSFDNRSVIFIFNGNNMPVIGYSGEFLFKQTVRHSNLQFYSNGTEDNSFDKEYSANTDVFRYYDRINDMKFKYGLKHEYYKNSHGYWIDMTAVRKNAALFLNMINGVIDEGLERGNFETSMYCKIADYIFNGLSEDSLLWQYVVNKTNIPRATFIDSKGKYWSIGPGDGTITTDEPSKYQFKRYLESEKIDNIHQKDDKYIIFEQVLSDYETGIEASKSYENNDAHKFDDLKLTFLHVDKTTPFTDLDNLMIFVNGLIVDYKRHPTIKNAIYLPNVKRLAVLQQVGLKSGYGPDSHKSEEEVGDRKCINYEFDNEKCKYSYKFDIQIHKWDNAKLSHFVTPINTKTILKSETYSTNTYWLPYKLQFANKIDKNKTILICSGEILPKTEWDVDPSDNHTIRLLYVDYEFEQLMNEMTQKMKLYLAQVIDHDIENEPQISDFITNYDSQDAINEGFNNYVAAMNEYINSESDGNYDKHYALSAITSVIKQFDNRSYSIVTVDKDSDVNYDLEFFENRDDIILDKPRLNQLMDLHWKLDDIVIINGMTHPMVNVYDSNFGLPMTTWLPTFDNIFLHADAYKLQVIKKIDENKTTYQSYYG